MFARVRNLSVAGGSALALTIVLSGVVAAGTVLSALTLNSEPAAPVVDTSKTFEDLDGNGIDDDCQTEEVVANPEVAASAAAAVDEDGDGTVSVSEAAHSDRTGGTNCNHGGYVSGVANAQCDEADTSEDAPTSGDADDVDEAEADADEAEADADEAEADEAEADEAEADSCDSETAETKAEEDAPAECETTPTEPVDEPAATPETTPEDVAPNAHGKAVSLVAQDHELVGGKNCNHGGAVSEAAKKDHEAAREARDAAKAAREAAREARRAEREAAREARKHGGH